MILLDQRFLRGHLLLGDQTLGDQLLIPLQVALGVLQPGLILLLLAQHLVQLALEWPWIDLGQHLSGADALAFAEENAHQLAVKTAADRDRVDRGHRAERFDLDLDDAGGGRRDTDRHSLPTREESLPFLWGRPRGAPLPIGTAGRASRTKPAIQSFQRDGGRVGEETVSGLFMLWG